MSAAANEITPAANALRHLEYDRRVDATGTMWRMRSLVAMGHDGTRIAHALAVSPHTIRKLLRGEEDHVSADLRDLACQLWNAWWDKRPAERTRDERRAAASARHQAQRRGWCTPLGLDEDELDEPGYRPYSRYRPAAGTGIAAEFRPVANAAPALWTHAPVVHRMRPSAGQALTTLPASPRLPRQTERTSSR
jgi:hypothetical protein